MSTRLRDDEIREAIWYSREKSLYVWVGESGIMIYDLDCVQRSKFRDIIVSHIGQCSNGPGRPMLGGMGVIRIVYGKGEALALGVVTSGVIGKNLVIKRLAWNMHIG